MMKKLVSVLFFFCLAMVLVVLIAPSFIDWGKYKPQISNYIEKRITRDLVIAGDIDFHIIPQPWLVLRNVRVAGVDGGSMEHFVTFDEIAVQMKIGPLLEGRFDVDSINLLRPAFYLEVLENGVVNWSGLVAGKKSERDKQGLMPALAESVRLNKVTVQDGRIEYRNHLTGAEMNIDSMTLVASAETLYGPYNIKGSTRWQDKFFQVDLTSGKYDGSNPLPLRVTLSPQSPMPTLKLSGVMDLQSGIEVQGELSASQGNIASLVEQKGQEQSFRFLRRLSDGRAMLEMKGRDIRFNDIRATFGKGEISGQAHLVFKKGQKPHLQTTLKAENIVLSDKKSPAVFVPKSYTADVVLDGNNIVARGVAYDSLTLDAGFDGREWSIAKAEGEIDGHSTITLSGVYNIAQKEGHYSLTVNTDNVRALAEETGVNIPVLKDMPAQVLKTANLKSDLNVTDQAYDLRNGVYVFDGNTRFTGAVKIHRTTQQEKYDLRLKAKSLNAAVYADDVYQKLLTWFLKTQSTFDVQVEKFSRKAFDGSKLAVKGNTGANGLYIDSLTMQGDAGKSLSLSGKVAGVNPYKGIDLVMEAKGFDPAHTTSVFGIAIPDFMRHWTKPQMKAQLTGGEGKYTYSAEAKINSTDVLVKGGFEREFPNVPLKHNLSLRVNGDNAQQAIKLFFPGFSAGAARLGKLSFFGEVSGHAEDLTVSAIEASFADMQVKGDVSIKTDDKGKQITANVNTGDRINLNKWLDMSSDPAQGGQWSKKAFDITFPKYHKISIKGSALELVWRSWSVRNSVFDVVMQDSGIKINSLTGKTLGGDMTMMLEADAGTPSLYAGNVDLTLKQAELGTLLKKYNVRGVKAGKADITVKLTSTGNSLSALLMASEGQAEITSNKVTLTDFSTRRIPTLINGLTSVPDNLSMLMAQSLQKNGDTSFEKLSVSFDVENGHATTQENTLSVENGDLKIKGAVNIPEWKYDVTAVADINTPENLPVFTIRRSGALSGAPALNVQAQDVAEFVRVKNTPVEILETDDGAGLEVEELLPPPEQKTSIPSAPSPENGGTIQDILKRLEE